MLMAAGKKSVIPAQAVVVQFATLRRALNTSTPSHLLSPALLLLCRSLADSGQECNIDRVAVRAVERLCRIQKFPRHIPDTGLPPSSDTECSVAIQALACQIGWGAVTNNDAANVRIGMHVKTVSADPKPVGS